MLDADWDLAVVLTDSPLRDGHRTLAVVTSPVHGVGLVSVPALGPVRVQGRAEETVVGVVTTLLGAEAEGRSPDRRLRQLAAGTKDHPGGKAGEGAARVVLLEYVRLYLAGHEATVADLFPKVDVDLGLALVRILADQGTAASEETILRATESPHPVVRIEALGHVEGQSSERLRQEMRALLDDADKSVRVAALTAMAQHKIKAAGPFLAMRIKGATFDALDGEERRLALDTVAILTAARAEALAMELLEPGSVFKNEAREATRMIAAELLGRIASSDEAKQVLERVSGQRLLASKGVREAAAQALKHLQERDNATKGTAS